MGIFGQPKTEGAVHWASKTEMRDIKVQEKVWIGGFSIRNIEQPAKRKGTDQFYGCNGGGTDRVTRSL